MSLNPSIEPGSVQSDGQIPSQNQTEQTHHTSWMGRNISPDPSLASSNLTEKFSEVIGAQPAQAESPNDLPDAVSEDSTTSKLSDKFQEVNGANPPSAVSPKTQPIISAHTTKLDHLAAAVGLASNEVAPSEMVAATLLQHKGMTSQDDYAVPALHLGNMDSGTVKGGRVAFAVRNIDGQERIMVNFQLTREGLGKLAGGLEKFQANLGGVAPEVTVERTEHRCYSSKGGKVDTVNGDSIRIGESENALVISIQGIGKIVIGQHDSDWHSFHGDATVILDPNISESEAGAILNKMGDFIGIGAIVSDSHEQDVEKFKMISMFQILYPKSTAELSHFLDSSMEDLKTKMFELEPDLKDTFDSNMARMYLQDVRPGQKEWALEGIADRLRTEAKAYGLMAGTKTLDSAVAMLRNGASSSHERFINGRLTKGESSITDIREGGGRSVFTRLINENFCKLQMRHFPFSGECQILYDLAVAERVCYMWGKDSYGSKDPSCYNRRDDVVKIARELRSTARDNELMAKGIPGQFVKGMVVQSEEKRLLLIDKLNHAGLVDPNGNINGKPVGDFVIVAPKFQKKFWE